MTTPTLEELVMRIEHLEATVADLLPERASLSSIPDIEYTIFVGEKVVWSGIDIATAYPDIAAAYPDGHLSITWQSSPAIVLI